MNRNGLGFVFLIYGMAIVAFLLLPASIRLLAEWLIGFGVGFTIRGACSWANNAVK